MPDTRPITPRPFPATGELALAEEHLAREYDERPRAFLELLLAEMDEPAGFRLVGDVGVVDVIGPLEQRGGWWWDGYDSVVSRAAEAFNDPRARSVVLALDSPGGAAAGNLAAARQLRAMADASGKPLVAHAGTIALSAAYALAVAADRICVTSDGAVGSIGVIASVVDRTKATAAMGLDVRVVRSGPLKADPHPDVPLTDASVARVRARVNELAGAFAAWVGERRGRPAEEVLSHQGATVYAARAIEAGLADAVGSLDEAITAAAEMAAARTKETDDMNDQQKLTALREQMGVTSDEEIRAGVATLKQHAAQLPEVTRQRDEALAALAQRDEADRQRERAEVLQRHVRRGAVTEAMQADAEYMATLAGLTAKQLDTNLSRLPVVAHARVEPAVGADGAAKGAAAATGTLSQIEKDAARAAGLTDDEYLTARAQGAQKKG